MKNNGLLEEEEEEKKKKIKHQYDLFNLYKMKNLPKTDKNKPIVGQMLKCLLKNELFTEGHIFVKFLKEPQKYNIIYCPKWWDEENPNILFTIIENILLLPDTEYLFWSLLSPKNPLLHQTVCKIQKWYKKYYDMKKYKNNRSN